MKNTRFLKALNREPVDRPPVWLMRQAGRYLPEYLALRAQEPNFMKFCKRIDLVTEAVMQPLARFDLDAAILFSDILTVPQAMGAALSVEPNIGPVVHEPIRTERQIANLHADSIDDLNYVFDAVSHIKKALNNTVPLIGFAGSPWTIATYLVEGGSSKLFQVIKKMAYAEPVMLHHLLTKITELTIAYLNAQVEAGADVIQVFDSWGGVLSTPAFKEFSLQYLQRIVDGVYREYEGRKIPLILFTKGGGAWLEDLADTGCDALGLDWTVDIAKARSRVGDRVALQGNMDPSVLLSTPQAVGREAHRILHEATDAPGFIFNLGHGIDKNTPIENVNAMLTPLTQKKLQTEHG
jgi:uroporphyrinogen decarboxylase